MIFRLLEPWRTRVLWLSLGLNLFAVAALAAPMLWHRRPPPGPPGFQVAIDHMARRLPPPDAERFRAAMAREQPWYDLSRERLNEARDAAATVVAREPFDPAAARAALQGMQERMRESAGRFDDSLVAALGTLSPEARATMVENFRRGRR